MPGVHYPASEHRYIRAAQDRFDWTLQWLTRHGVAGKSVLEIGTGVIGVCCRLMGAATTAWDVRRDFEEVAERLGIDFIYTDLSIPGTWPRGDEFDIVILAEVLEHIPVSPIDTLKGIHATLKPGGTVVLTTPNLLRLSNRIRMLTGKALFAPFSPEALVMGHVREYTLSEVANYATRAGFDVLKCEYHNWDLGHLSPLAPLLGVVPSLSNCISLIGRKAR
jgi:2-polyprenyl-3-methyl-5-hydroxy-6-metoxy-1,4-benzoquinol methylase